jgi:hypothetical protein
LLQGGYGVDGFCCFGKKRLAQEGYFEGTTYDGTLFISVEKKLNESQSLNFTGFYTNTRKNSPNTAEVTELTSENTIPWGFQEGKKRNARNKTIEEPILMLNHFFKINDHTNLNSFDVSIRENWKQQHRYQSANSPDPTYFRKLPSYYSSIYARDNGEYSGEFSPIMKMRKKADSIFS